MGLDSITAEEAPGAARLIERLQAGDVRALARAISLIEDEAPEAIEILAECFPLSGSGMRIGITGAPGVGKSTLVDALRRGYRQRGITLGLLAIDPSSPYTGGAILGDRIRVQSAESDPGVYMRSMATRGSLGGLARATADVVTVVEASGKARILIETVGAGQAETDIARLADVTIVMLAPGMGDAVQNIKAGIMEIADIFVVNKCDREGAERVEMEVRSAQSLAPPGEWVPAVVRTVAATGEGVAELAERIEEFWSWLRQEDRLIRRRELYWREQIPEMVRQELLWHARRGGLELDALLSLPAEIARKRENPYRSIPEMIGRSLHERESSLVDRCRWPDAGETSRRDEES